MNALLFSAFLSAQTPVPFGDPEREALRYGSKALLYELELDAVTRRLEKRLVPKKIRPYIVVSGTLVRIAVERRVSYTWRF